MQQTRGSNTEIVSTPAPAAETAVVQCPACGSDAVYRYGRTRHDKQRFQCLICRRQFSLDSTRQGIACKPICPNCDRPMHVYKREGRSIRFRCANYPHCRVYCKLQQLQNNGAADGGK